MSSDLTGYVDAICSDHLPVGAELWVGLSGGLDSMVLLHLCKNIADSGRLCGVLKAVHVHHGLSPHADEWAEFCRICCADWGIPLEVVKVHVSRNSQIGIEAAARSARYQAFRDVGARYIALAHHRRDQVETLLFNLCRGAGVSGAAAMQPFSVQEHLFLLRPLLAASMDVLVQYAVAAGLNWVEDESNQDESYTRNFLRHKVLPLLESRFPAVEGTLARATRHFSEAETLLQEVAERDDEEIQADVSRLLQLSEPRQVNWLRYWLRQGGWQVPGTAALTEALRQIRVTPGDGKFEFRLPEGSVRLWSGRLYRVSATKNPPHTVVHWQGESDLAWGERRLRFERVTGRGLDWSRLAGLPLTIRVRQGGEKIQPGQGRPTRPLKKLLQEAGVVPWERDRLPLIFIGDQFVACPGIVIAADWQCTADAEGLLPVWSQG